MNPVRPIRETEAPRTNRAAPFARSTRARWVLVIMAKQPVMGRVKTRLARQSGASEALRFYRNTLRTVTRRLGTDPRWTTVLAIAPDDALAAPTWPPGVARTPQGRGDLGQRMQRLLQLPHADRVLVVGTDIPAITPAHIADAFRLLGGHDAVFGPALDGGYWLVGLRRSPRVHRPFSGVRWSAPETLADTRANLRGRRVALATPLSDVDTLADLHRLSDAAARLVPPAAVGSAPATTALEPPAG